MPGCPVMSGDHQRILAFDLETTGLEPERDRILEFCFIEVDAQLKQVGTPFASLVDPEIEIPEQIQQITGIKPEMVAGKAPFRQHAPRIQRLVEGAVLVAHNYRFDVAFLHAELSRAGQTGLAPNHPCIDTLGIERVVNGHGLEACFERYTGEKFDGAHRSQADTEAMLTVLRAQMDTHASVLGDDPLELTQVKLAQLRDPEADVRTWLDHGHRFYQDASGVVRFGFSKHRHEPVLDHMDFLQWMRSRDFPTDTLQIVERLLSTPPTAGQAGQTRL